MMRNVLFIIGFTLIGFTSCLHDEVYFRYNEMKDGNWGATDELVFDIDSTLIKVDVPYKIMLEITNNSDYKYENIWLDVQHNFVSDSLISEERQFILTDKSGKWLGTGFASLYQTSVLYAPRVEFTEKRNYMMRIKQVMKDNPLHGIEKLGVRIVPIK